MLQRYVGRHRYGDLILTSPLKVTIFGSWAATVFKSRCLAIQNQSIEGYEHRSDNYLNGVHNHSILN